MSGTENLRLNRGSGRGRGLAVPTGVMLWDDGTPERWDDGTYMIWS